MALLDMVNPPPPFSTAATLNVGDVGKPGLLKITGTYTQLNTCTMNVSVGGTTVGTHKNVRGRKSVPTPATALESPTRPPPSPPKNLLNKGELFSVECRVFRNHCTARHSGLKHV
ncbi:MAG TPA: hypothetical protein VMQ17_25090 [Candidatus Sulfotelmatobacter sp.]|nr:hypothetical protein [Candidatus Sulfotelmatobacter sp.]